MPYWNCPYHLSSRRQCSKSKYQGMQMLILLSYSVTQHESIVDGKQIQQKGNYDDASLWGRLFWGNQYTCVLLQSYGFSNDCVKKKWPNAICCARSIACIPWSRCMWWWVLEQCHTNRLNMLQQQWPKRRGECKEGMATKTATNVCTDAWGIYQRSILRVCINHQRDHCEWKVTSFWECHIYVF